MTKKNAPTKPKEIGKPGTSAKRIRIKPTIVRIFPLFAICVIMSPAKFVCELFAARVVMIPVAVAIISAGICPTSPSPMVRIVKVSALCLTLIPCSNTPIRNPPMIFTIVIMMEAMASPLTNLLAPSIVP